MSWTLSTDDAQRSQSARLGSTLFHPNDIYSRLRSFKNHLNALGRASDHLFFVKVDVQACYDTIPQGRVLSLVEDLAREEEYRIGRYAEIRPSETMQRNGAVQALGNPFRRFRDHARAAYDFSAFSSTVEHDLAVGKSDRAFIECGVPKTQRKEALLDLFEDHLRRNLVRIGKKVYRQKAGIPQGSALSSLLCNFFYGDFERTCLDFLSPTESLLLRMTDDFLLVTLNREHAHRFLDMMHRGIPDYGITVKPSKSLANIPVRIDATTVPHHADRSLFPFCGNLINTKTLEISKDRMKSNGVGESSPVELIVLMLLIWLIFTQLFVIA